MTSERIEEQVRILRDQVSGVVTVEPDAFDGALAQLYHMRDPAIIPALCTVFDDDFQYREMLYSIVHVMESFRLDRYISCLAKGSENLANDAPEWGRTLLIGILNNVDARNEFSSQFGNFASVQRQSFEKIATSLISVYPEFREPWEIATHKTLRG